MFRRSFIKSISLFSLTPFLGWNKLFNWFNFSKPTNGKVQEFIALKTNWDESFQLHWEDPIPLLEAGPPKNWTWREFILNGYGETEENLTKDYLEHDWELSLEDLDKPVDQSIVDNWWFEYGVNDTTSSVFYYLQSIGLSDELTKDLEWYESPNPGSSYIGVEVENKEVLQKLEKELNLLGENIRFKIQDP